jgi:hypothetical protein
MWIGSIGVLPIVLSAFRVSRSQASGNRSAGLSWAVFVWLPVTVVGGRKRRVISVDTQTADTRLPHEVPWPAFAIISSVAIGAVVLATVRHGELVALLAVIVWGLLLRAVANRRSR